MSNASLLLLADGRLPAGGYAHSGGLEELIISGKVHDAGSLEKFLIGRAATTGLVAGTFCAAACYASTSGDVLRLQALDPALDARMPSPALRKISRTLGRQMARVAASIQSNPHLDELVQAPHQPVVFGVAAAGFDLSPQQAALAVLHETVAGPAAAALKLLSLDPFTAHAALARLGPLLDELAAESARHIDVESDDMPAFGAPMLDIAAEQHSIRKVRLFAS